MPTPLRLQIYVNLEPHGQHPGISCLSPDGSSIVIPCQDTDNILVVSKETLELKENIPAPPGTAPWMAVAAPEQWVLVSLSGFKDNVATNDPSQILFIDQKDWAVKHEVAVGVGANGIAVVSRVGKAFVANARSNTVSAIDMKTFTVEKTISVPEAPFSIVDIPERDEIAVACFGAATVAFVSTVTYEVAYSIVVGNAALSEPNPEWGHGDTTWFYSSGPNRGVALNWRSSELVTLDLDQRTIIERHPSPSQRPFLGKPSGIEGHSLVTTSSKFDVHLLTASMKPADSLAVRDLGFPSGPMNQHNVLSSDPDDHSAVVFAPKGLNGLATNVMIEAAIL